MQITILMLVLFILMLVGMIFLNVTRKKFKEDPELSASQYFLRTEGIVSLVFLALSSATISVSFLLWILTGDDNIFYLTATLATLFYVIFTFISARILTSSHEHKMWLFGRRAKSRRL